MVLEYFLFKVNLREITVKKLKGDSPLRGSNPDCTCANTDYLLHRFDVCILLV